MFLWYYKFNILNVPGEIKMEDNKIKLALSNSKRFHRALIVSAMALPVLLMIATLTALSFQLVELNECFLYSIFASLIGVIIMAAVHNEGSYTKRNVIIADTIIGLTASFISFLTILMGLNKSLQKVISLLFNFLFSFVIMLIVAAVTFVIIITTLQAIYNIIKWISWNGYSENMIAVTKKGNIKKFNKIKNIQEKLDTTASIEEVIEMLNSHSKEVASNLKWYHFFW